jgi:SAM-dependent methyltransferase
VTRFEWTYLCLQPFFPVVHRQVRARALRFLRSRRGEGPLRLLDVGGRKSHYTIGLPARVTITDLPRESDVQVALNLGITDEISAQTRRRRSNVEAILYDDMTRSKLPDAHFDCVLAIEVLEHVEADDAFVAHVARVLGPGGAFFMSTPNGDYLDNRNPDHVRHYKRAGLRELLEGHFPHVDVAYAVKGGRFRSAGIRRWSARHPWRTLGSMGGNVVNAIQSRRAAVSEQATGTHHLVAAARC